MKTTIAVLCVVIVASAAGGMMVAKYSTDRMLSEISRPVPQPQPLARQTPAARPAAKRDEIQVASATPGPAETPAPLKNVSPTPTAQPAQEAIKPKKTYQAPPTTSGPIAPEVARLALSFVGANADAEKVWVTAINDPTRPANERKDLIEDLNEDGLSDPKNPTAGDLPLIVNRMAIIQRLAPSAADDTNAAAFAEAYKDLSNMYNDLTSN